MAIKKNQPVATPKAAEPKKPTVKTVKMIRAEPMHAGGPTEADVHPDEVENMASAGWRKSE